MTVKNIEDRYTFGEVMKKVKCIVLRYSVDYNVKLVADYGSLKIIAVGECYSDFCSM